MQSHPMWVRGLKHEEKGMDVTSTDVAPYVGAWIETSFPMGTRVLRLSHPMWVRGLKLCIDRDFIIHQRRTLCGCVD